MPSTRTFLWSRPNWQISARSRKMSSEQTVTYVTWTKNCFSEESLDSFCLSARDEPWELDGTCKSEMQHQLWLATKSFSVFFKIFCFWGDFVLLHFLCQYIPARALRKSFLFIFYGPSDTSTVGEARLARLGMSRHVSALRPSCPSFCALHQRIKDLGSCEVSFLAAHDGAAPHETRETRQVHLDLTGQRHHWHQIFDLQQISTRSSTRS